MKVFTVVVFYEGRISTRTELESSTTQYADTQVHGFDQAMTGHDRWVGISLRCAEKAVFQDEDGYGFDHELYHRLMVKEGYKSL